MDSLSEKKLQERLKQLSPEQYSCTQENGTERPFANIYWNNKEDGIYVDVVTGEPLFLSLTKYDSGSGWPSFTQPIMDQNVPEQHLVFKKDQELNLERIEVRSRIGDSHLGHVFDDGPTEAGGKRYCINSASLNFIPLEKMKEKGYGSYLFQFSQKKNWKTAILAGGCFWGVEELFRTEKGVIETVVGYTGGTLKDPTYEVVKKGLTGHAEALKILFDPTLVSFEALLKLFFKLHDPTSTNRQGNDIGTQYRSSIFFLDEDQKKVAERVKALVDTSGVWKKPVVTEILAASDFYSAEEFHQKYLLQNPGGYTCHFVRDLKFE